MMENQPVTAEKQPVVQKFKKITSVSFDEFGPARAAAREKFLVLTGLKTVPPMGMQTDDYKVRIRLSTRGGKERFDVVSYAAIPKEKPAQKQETEAKKDTKKRKA